MLRWHECETLNFIGGILFFKFYFLRLYSSKAEGLWDTRSYVVKKMFEKDAGRRNYP